MGGGNTNRFDFLRSGESLSSDHGYGSSYSSGMSAQVGGNNSSVDDRELSDLLVSVKVSYVSALGVHEHRFFFPFSVASNCPSAVLGRRRLPCCSVVRALNTSSLTILPVCPARWRRRWLWPCGTCNFCVTSISRFWMDCINT